MGQLSFERHSLANLSSFANAINIPFGMVSVTTGIVMIVMATTVGAATAVEFEAEAPGVVGTIWLKNLLAALKDYMRSETTCQM